MDAQAVNSVFQIPWPAIITGFTGLVGALGGAFLANLYAEKRWDKQQEQELLKERRNLLRDKGEAAFIALKKWEKELHFFHSSRIAFLQGTITREALQKTIDEKVDPSTHGKIESLIDLYFEEFSLELEAIHNQIKSVNYIYRMTEKSNTTTYGVPNGVELIMKECAVYERQFEHFFRKLKLRMKSI